MVDQRSHDLINELQLHALFRLLEAILQSDFLSNLLLTQLPKPWVFSVTKRVYLLLQAVQVSLTALSVRGIAHPWLSTASACLFTSRLLAWSHFSVRPSPSENFLNLRRGYFSIKAVTNGASNLLRRS